MEKRQYINFNQQIKTMKKSLLIAAILLSTTTLFAQSKTEPKAAPTKPQYQKVVQIPIEDFNLLTQQLNERKNTVIYTPNIKPEEAVQMQKGIDAYLVELSKRVKLDSVKVEGK